MMGNATGCDERGQPHAAVSNEDDWKPALWAGHVNAFVNEGKQRQAYDQVDALGLIGQLRHSIRARLLPFSDFQNSMMLPM